MHWIGKWGAHLASTLDLLYLQVTGSKKGLCTAAPIDPNSQEETDCC